MKTQLKLAATIALTALGYAAATPVLAFPPSAIEFSQLETPLASGMPSTRASSDRAFPITGMEPATPTSGSGIDD